MASPILVHSKASLERSPSPGRLSVDSASLKTSLAQSCSWLPMSRVGLPARFCVHPAERKVSVTKHMLLKVGPTDLNSENKAVGLSEKNDEQFWPGEARRSALRRTW